MLAYAYIGVIGVVFQFIDLYKGEDSYFRFGPPIVFFNKRITDERMYILIHVIVFIHQLVNNCVNSIVYPWIINTVQNTVVVKTGYSDLVTILLVNAFDLYSELDTALILIGFTSQVSFIFTFTLANLITSSVINWGYLRGKRARMNEALINDEGSIV